MRGDTRLDYVEIQLFPSRTRCEVHVSADGLTEKLASGLLKSFLIHLEAAEEQVSRGATCIRLECQSSSLKQKNRPSWFTRGTIERFVSFVSSPEVLEKVKTIEDELEQLRFVRSIQAKSLNNTNGWPLHTDDAASIADTWSTTRMHHKINDTGIPSRRYPFNIFDDGAEDSKRELLRAMDARLVALQQEQDVAFACAIAAGFEKENLADLLAFAERFGANLLREACMEFLFLSRKRYEANSELEKIGSANEEPSSSGSDKSVSSGTECDFPEESEMISHVEARSICKPPCDADAESWGVESNNPSSTFPFKCFASTSDRDGLPHFDSNTGLSEVPSLPKRRNLLQLKDVQSGYSDMRHLESNNSCVSSINVCSSSHEKMAYLDIGSTFTVGIKVSDPCVSSMENHAPATTRSSLTANEKRLGHIINNIQSHGNASNCHLNAGQTVSSSEFVTRLSVQDAINLFERKRRDSSDGTEKKLLKQESCKGLIESGNHPLSGKSTLRRWSRAQESNCELISQQDRNVIIERETNSNKMLTDTMKQSHTSMDGKEEGLMRTKADQNQPVGISQESLQELSNSKLFSASNKACWQLPYGSKSESYLPSETSDMQLSKKKPPLPTLESQPFSETSYRQLSMKQQCSLRCESPLISEISEVELPLKHQNLLLNLQNSMEKDQRNEYKLELAKKLQINDFASANSHPSLIDVDSETKEPSIKGNAVRLTDGSHAKIKQPPSKRSGSSEQVKTCLPGDYLNNYPQYMLDNRFPTTSYMEHSDTKPESRGQSFLPNEMSKQHTIPSQDSLDVVAFRTVLRDQMDEKNGIHSELMVSLHNVYSPSSHDKIKGGAGLSMIEASNIGAKIDDKCAALSSNRSDDNASLEFNLQALVSIVDHQNHYQSGLGYDGSMQIQRGRFYEYYCQLRDIKQREEHISKRAERVAKLKAMSEALDKRMAEMEAKSARLSKKNSSFAKLQMQAEKFEALKASLLTNYKQKESNVKGQSNQEDHSIQIPDKSNAYTIQSNTEESDPESHSMLIQDQTNTTPTLSSSPHVREVVPFSISCAVKKGAPSFQKCATMPHRSNRVPNSLSRTSMPKNSMSKFLSQQKSSAAFNHAGLTENSLTQSVPCFSDLRKENTKPSPGCIPGSATHSRNKTHSGHLRKKNEALEVKGISVRSPVSNKDNKKPSLRLMRKSCGTTFGLKILPEQGREVDALTSLKVQKEAAVPRAGHGMVKLKSSITTGNRGSNEEPQLSFIFNAEVGDPGSIGSEEGIKGQLDTFVDAAVIENITGELPHHQDQQPKTSEVAAILDDLAESLETDRKCRMQHITSFHLNTIQHKQDDSRSKQLETLVTPTSSFNASSLPSEHMLLDFSPAVAPPFDSFSFQSDAHSGHVSPRSLMTLESPIRSPASWSSKQIQHVSEADNFSMKIWRNSQKPVLSASYQPHKEHVKGLRRLLKFGRKSHTSETATTDCISTSATSEGDDETRDTGNQSADELVRMAGIQESGFGLKKATRSVESFVIQDQNISQIFRSSIPAPPANFKLRDDHLSSGTLLRAPRSFFSLSSFRSKGSEGKIQ